MEINGKEIPVWAIIVVAAIAAIILILLLCVCIRCLKSSKSRVAAYDYAGGAKADKSNSLGVANGTTGYSDSPYATIGAAEGATTITIGGGPEGFHKTKSGDAQAAEPKPSPHTGANFWRKVLRAPGFKDVARKKKAQQRCKSFQQWDLLQITRATRNFHKKLLIGKGGTSEVYRGMGPNGAQWAVKRSLWRPRGSDGEELLTFRPANPAAYAELVADFEKGANSLAVLCHQNVIQLLGYCIESGERVLIYEHVGGPSLELMILGDADQWKDKIQWRRGSRNARALMDLGVVGEGEEQGIPFDFMHRLLIAVDIADAVAYLHTEFPTPYLHEGLHPRNILFDSNGMPKVGNIGQMKVLMTRDIAAGSSMLSGLPHRPTLTAPGYIDPSFHITGKSSLQNDVYAFGVILMQIFTGRPAVIENKPGEATAKLDLGTWVSRRLRQGGESSLETIVDPRLGGAYPADVLLRVLLVGLDCQQFPAKKRPTMDKVAEELLAMHEQLMEEGGVVMVDVPEPEAEAGEFEAGEFEVAEEGVQGGEEGVGERMGEEIVDVYVDETGAMDSKAEGEGGGVTELGEGDGEAEAEGKGKEGEVGGSGDMSGGEESSEGRGSGKEEGKKGKKEKREKKERKEKKKKKGKGKRDEAEVESQDGADNSV